MKKKYESPELVIVEVEIMPLLEASLGSLNDENANGDALGREDEEIFDLIGGSPLGGLSF